MKSLKELLENYINDNITTPEKELLNQTFADAAEFQNFRNIFVRRIVQQKQQHRLKVAFYIACVILASLGTTYLIKKSYEKTQEKMPLQKDIALVEPSVTVKENFDKAYHQTLSNVRKDIKVDDVAWKTAYNASRFRETVQIIEYLGTEASSEATYTLAMCFIQLKQYNKAILPFKQLIDNDPQQLKTFTPEARWLLANVYIKLNRQMEAKKLLLQLVNEDAPHVLEAKVLLNQL